MNILLINNNIAAHYNGYTVLLFCKRGVKYLTEKFPVDKIIIVQPENVDFDKSWEIQKKQIEKNRKFKRDISYVKGKNLNLEIISQQDMQQKIEKHSDEEIKNSAENICCRKLPSWSLQTVFLLKLLTEKESAD